MPPEDLEEWELLSPGEVELDGSTLGSEVLTQVLRRCAATSAKRTSESRECATSPSVRIFLSCAQVCRRWKRISDNHVAWPDLLRSEGVISVEVAELNVGLLEGATGGPAWHRGTGETEGLAESWVEMEPPMQLSPHDCKLLYCALKRPREVPAEDSAPGSLWDTVGIIPGSLAKAEELPSQFELPTMSALCAGRSIMKITLAGGIMLAAASCVTTVLPWWQRPVARWMMKSYAVEWCWLTVTGSSMWGASEASERPTVTSVAASAVGGGAAAYLGTLGFVAIM